MQAAVQLLRHVDPWHPLWTATKGASGPLSALYAAADAADRLGFVGGDIEQWHPDVRERKLAELTEAEARLSCSIHGACRTILGHTNDCQ